MNIFDPNFTGRFELFTPSHIVAMVLIALLWVLVPLWLRNAAGGPADRILRYSLAALLVVQYVGWMIWEGAVGRFTLGTSLPVNLCDFSNFLCAVLLVNRSYRLFEILYFFALAGTIQSYITPNIYYSFPHFEFFAFYIQHGGEILTVLYLTIVHRMRPRPVSMLKAYGALVVLIVAAYLINRATGGNYNFLMRDTPQPSTVTKMIALFGAPPRHIIGLGLVGAVSVVILYSPFWIIDWVGGARRGERKQAA